MGFFSFLFGKSAAKPPSSSGNCSQILQEAISCLRNDQWNRAGEKLELAGRGISASTDAVDLVNLSIALAIVYGAAGESQRAAEAIKSILPANPPESPLGKFVRGVLANIQSPSNPMPTPFTVRGKPVSMSFFVDKEVFVDIVEKRTIDRERVMQRVIEKITEASLNPPDEMQ